jgi:hypothetical protein
MKALFNKGAEEHKCNVCGSFAACLALLVFNENHNKLYFCISVFNIGGEITIQQQSSRFVPVVGKLGTITPS